MKIVTHSGQAHADDLMAVSLILIKEGLTPGEAQIVRVPDGKAEDFNADFVVDVGRQYDPDKRWFDHHQFPVDAPPECALTLVAKYYGITRADLKWMDRLAYLDCRGPWEWFRNQFGRRAKNWEECEAALGTTDVFSWFCREANATYKNPNAFADALKYSMTWLKGEIDYIPNRKENYKTALSNLRIIDMDGFKIAHFNQVDSRGVRTVCDEVSAKDPSIIVTTKPDDRGNGFSAMRMNDCQRVNFASRSGEPGCVFAAKQGFCLKWSNDWTSFLEAVAKSVRDEYEGEGIGRAA